MMMQPDISVGWIARAVPLESVCLAAFGGDARTLARRMESFGESRLGLLRAVAVPDGFLLLGPAESLPWMPGVMYLGVDPRAPDLRLPTHSQPDVPLELFDAAVRGRCPRLPAAVLPHAGLLVPLDGARPLSAAALRRWLDDNRGA